MKPIFNFFRRLQWKLALSYALVTAGTVIVLTLKLLLLATYFDNASGDKVWSSYYWTKTGFQDNIPYMLDDRKKLQSWLERVQVQGFVESDFKSDMFRETMDHAHTLITGQPIFVLDTGLNVIAAAPLKDPGIIGKPYEEVAPQGYEIMTISAATLKGNKDYIAQSIQRPDGSYLAAFPLRKSDTSPIAAIVVYQGRPIQTLIPANFEIYRTFFIIVVAVMFFISLPLGAVFGWLASRGLRKRLVRLAEVTQAWSQGDFSSAPSDQSGDEIGDLTRALNRMAEQLQTHITTRNELARIEERNRLARDLHDTVKQQTYAARMQLSAAKNLLKTKPAQAAEHIESALQLNRETQQELKLIIDELRPAALDGRGLAQALRDYAGRWQEHTGIQIEAHVSGERSLPLDTEQALYRVAQEALSNVARHAEATSVTLDLDIDAAHATLAIADNGRGFDPSAIPANSLGLESMKHRLADIQGALTVESAAGHGTKIVAEVKL